MKEYAIIHEHGNVPDTLRSLPFLGSFDDEELDDVLNSSSYIQCEVGDVIIEEGEIESRIYILLSGAVSVSKGGKTLATISRIGEIFGELAVVNQERRSASVIASANSVCLAVDQKFLQDMKPREENQGFYAALFEFIARVTAGRLEVTSRRLSEVERELRELKAKHAKARTPAKSKTVARPLPVKKPAAKRVITAKRLPARRASR
jgi:CRP/FNR family cyclic AMP-dependent transcriptional regulator